MRAEASNTLRQSLSAGHSLSGGSQHEAIRRLIQIARAAADKPEPLPDVNRKAHPAIGRDVGLDCHAGSGGWIAARRDFAVPSVPGREMLTNTIEGRQRMCGMKSLLEVASRCFVLVMLRSV
jgi:hypothetical protein